MPIALLCFVLFVLIEFLMDAYDSFTRILQGCFTGTNQKTAQSSPYIFSDSIYVIWD